MSKRIDSKGNNVFKLKIIIALIAAIYHPALYAESNETATANKPINTTLPERNSYQISAGSLTKALSKYAGSNGLTFSFDPRLTNSKTTLGLTGNYRLQEGFDALLKDTGLEAVSDRAGGYRLKRVTPKIAAKNLSLEEVEVRAKRFYEIGPLPGLGLTKEEIPGNVQTITAKEIKEAHSLSLADLFSKKLQSVTVNDYQGNPFQMDVQYRGFTAGPQIGTPQGLSVFFDGIRVNEPFGDVVNWDMIPMNAIASVDVFPGSNPVFGLNTLGGAFTVKTKDGFNFAGLDAEVLAGSYGRKQLQVEGGWNNGDFALFGAGNFFMEDGWREDSPTEVNQFFGKASYRGDKLDLNLSTLLVGNDMVGNGLLPSEMYAQDRNASFTSEDTTKNRLKQFQLSAAFQANDNFSITGQVYRRNSKRHQVNGDVFTDWNEKKTAKAYLADGDEYTCLFKSTNEYGLPDYIVVPINVTIGEDFFTSAFITDYFTNGGVVDLSAYAFNAPLTDATFVAAYQEVFYENRNFYARTRDRDGAYTTPSSGLITDYAVPIYGYTISESSYAIDSAPWTGATANQSSFPGENINLGLGINNYYYSKNGAGNDIKNYVIPLPTINGDKCQSAAALEYTSSDFNGPYNFQYENTPLPTSIDGGSYGQSGYAEGTPTALITENDIDQTTDGASIQFNWNLEHHKFMIGASIDAASASYSNTQLLGLLDADRNAFLAPDLIHPQFAAATIPISNNNFSGTNTTKSIYFSETWTPVETWHFNASGRYNATQSKNKIATRWGTFNYNAGDLLNYPYAHDTCTSDEDCANTETGYRAPSQFGNLNDSETEAFSYYSFNPSLGATWQAKENLNIYANWSKGTRTPSVIELGCALEHGPGTEYFLAPGETYTVPKSVTENRQCYLPTTLSGDPYLPQIKATSYDVGLRGSIGKHLQWNLGAYQTDLKDDIYFVAVPGGSGSSGFFDSIGKTRRRGIEAGLSGQQGKWGFSLNYALTDATFENDFFMYSEDNSSAGTVSTLGPNAIKVEKGATMPGVPLHNLNASISYAVTPKWQVGMSAIVHSESYVRGNENNKHKQGAAPIRTIIVTDDNGNITSYQAERQQFTNPGKLPGYATFNFQTSYQFNAEWTATMLVNNVFDKEYFSAGRLGRNPFSPSINGAISVSGYNHNSSDWLSTNFISPSAPRGIWFSLNWQFDPKKAY